MQYLAYDRRGGERDKREREGLLDSRQTETLKGDRSLRLVSSRQATYDVRRRALRMRCAAHGVEGSAVSAPTTEYRHGSTMGKFEAGSW
jgi:hypothetical protein